MSEPVVTVGHKFQGICHACGDKFVTGEMVEGVENRRIEGKDICVTGSKGRGYCGHETKAVGLSEVFFLDGIPVVRLGDPVEGVIDGVLIEGSDFVTSD